MGADKIVKRIDGAHNPAVVPARGKGVDQCEESFVSPSVVVLEHLLDGVGAQDGHFAVIENAEVGRDIELIEKLAHEIAAEAVNRADMCPRHENLLALQMHVARVLLEQQSNLPGNAGAHLCGGSAGKGNNEQPVGGRGMYRIGQPLEHTLDENGCFSRPGRRRDEQASSACADRVGLRLSPFSCHAPPPP